MIEQELKNYLKENKIVTTKKQVEKIEQYLQIVQSINPHINLVADSSTESLIYVHLHDSLQMLKVISDTSASGNWIDIGSGGGFPGIIAAIMFPSIQVHLIESMRKKYSFLLYVLVFISLPNITVFHERAENVVKLPEVYHQNCIFTARAVGTVEYLSLLFENALLKDGKVVLWKDITEVEEFLSSHSQWICQDHIVYPSLNKDKHMVCLRKKVFKGDNDVSKGKKFCSSGTRTRNC